jgi:hypothetical protein
MLRVLFDCIESLWLFSRSPNAGLNSFEPKGAFLVSRFASISAIRIWTGTCGQGVKRPALSRCEAAKI